MKKPSNRKQKRLNKKAERELKKITANMKLILSEV